MTIYRCSGVAAQTDGASYRCMGHYRRIARGVTAGDQGIGYVSLSWYHAAGPRVVADNSDITHAEPLCEFRIVVGTSRENVFFSFPCFFLVLIFFHFLNISIIEIWQNWICANVWIRSLRDCLRLSLSLTCLIWKSPTMTSKTFPPPYKTWLWWVPNQKKKSNT